MKRLWFVGGLGGLVLAGTVSAGQGGKAELFPAALDEYVAGVAREWEIPGAAIAVVHDGALVVAKGYGVLEMGKPDRVDGATIFDAASLTKSFTAAAVASLVDEQKMGWDEPVRRYLPALAFPDPYLTANVTVRDLLCHRTGVRATNSAWYFTGITRGQLPGLVRNMEMAAPFRTRSLYSNVGYTLVGEAAAAVAGTTWEELVTRRLIAPLGLQRTTADFASAPALGNVASGHAVIEGAQRVAPREGAPRTTTAPAGAVQSSAADLATWMLFELGDGTFGGKRILSADVVGEMHSPQIVFSTTEAFRTARQIKYFAAYGLGWQVFDYRGHTLLWHSGGGDGQAAYMALVPDARLGVVVLMNSSKAGSALNAAVAARIMDRYLGLPTRDYSAEFRESRGKSLQRQAEADRLRDASRLPNTTPSLPPGAYAGAFRDRLGLDVEIWLDSDGLKLRYGGGENASLTHWHHDVFQVRWQNPLHAEQQSTFVSFRLSAEGKVDGLRMEPFGDVVEATRVEER